MALASSSFIFQPPDRPPTTSFCRELSKPTSRSCFRILSRGTCARASSSSAGSCENFRQERRNSPDAMKSITDDDVSSPWSACSTIIQRNSSLGGKFSTFPSRSWRIRVDFPLPFAPKIPYRRPRYNFKDVCDSRRRAPYAREKTISQRSSPSSEPTSLT